MERLFGTYWEKVKWEPIRDRHVLDLVRQTLNLAGDAPMLAAWATDDAIVVHSGETVHVVTLAGTVLVQDPAEASALEGFTRKRLSWMLEAGTEREGAVSYEAALGAYTKLWGDTKESRATFHKHWLQRDFFGAMSPDEVVADLPGPATQVTK